jgi:hypothetical protein
MTMPTLVLEDVNVLRAAVPSEFMQSCERRHRDRAITVGESLGRSVVGKRTNIAASDKHSRRIQRCVILFEDPAGMVWVAIEVQVDRLVTTVILLAGNRCSCGHRLVSLLRWFVVVGFDEGDAIVGQRQHERAAVVPIDIDLRPIVMLVNINDGPERSNGDRIWILRHRHQANAIAFLQTCLHSQSFLVSFGVCVELVEQFAGLSESCVDLGHRVNVPPTQRWVIGWLQCVKRLTQSIEVVASYEMQVLVGSCRLKNRFCHGWFLVVGKTEYDPQQSASKSRKHQANMRACFANFFQTCGCAGELQFHDVSRSVECWAYVRINEKTPTRCERGAIGGKRSVLRACLQVVRYQDGSAVAGDCDRISASGSGEQRGTLADYIHHAADVELPIVDCSQVVGDAWLWRCDLAVGQVIYRSQIVKVFHRFGLLASNGEASAFGLYELAIVALGQVAKDRAVQGRVGRLATGTRPVSLGFHRGDQLLRVHRFARFAENLQGRSDAAQSLFAGVGGLGGCRLCLAWLLENRNRCGRFASDRFDGHRFVLDHGYVAFGGDLRASALRTHFALQALGALDKDLLAGCEVGRVPAASRLLGIDANLTTIARNVRVVLAADLYFCLLHLGISKSEFVVGCHRQADRTTDRLRASVLRFGLLTKDQVRQSLAEKVDYHLDLCARRRNIQAAVEVEHHLAVGQALNPKLRNLALVQFVRFVFCVFGEDQGVEAVFVVDLALHPRSASAAVAIADLGDRQVEVVLGHLLVSVVWLVNRFRVNTHEPCGLNRIKPDSKGIRILLFGAYLRAEMLGELCGCGLHISQLVEEPFHGRWVCGGEDRHLFDRCVQVADRLERSSVRAEELGRGQAWSVGHGWHRVALRLFVVDVSYAMTHMSHAVQTASSRRGKDSEGFPEPFPRRIGVLRSAIATCFPSSLAAVADLPAFDDVDRVVVGDVLVIVVGVRILIVRFVHVAAAGHAADAVLERPVLLGHQPYFGVASELFAVVVEDFDQGVEIHVWFSVWVNENWLCDNTHEPCGSDDLKPSFQCFQQVFSAFFGRQTFVDRFGQHAASEGIDGVFEHAEFCFESAGRISARYHERAGQVLGHSLQPCDHFAVFLAEVQRGSAMHLFEGGSDSSVSGVGSGHRFVLLLRGEGGWSLGDDTHEPCGSKHSKPVPAAFPNVLPCFSGDLTGPNVGPCCDVLNVGSLVEGAHKNATVGERRDQAEERRASVRGVRGIPLVCGLEDLSEAAVLHRVQGLDRVEVFGEKRAGAGRLLCVGDLEGLRQGHQTLDRLVVGFADLLGLVGVHRLEDLAKGCVRSCVWVVCVGHVCVSVSEKGLNRLRDDTHEPCGSKHSKPIPERFQNVFRNLASLPSSLLKGWQLCVSLYREPAREAVECVVQVIHSSEEPQHFLLALGWDSHLFKCLSEFFEEFRCGKVYEVAIVGGDLFGSVEHLCVSWFELGNRLCDDTHEPCGFINIKPSPKTFQKESAGGAGPPANPRYSLVLFQKELEHGSLLVEELELGFRLACVSQIAFGEFHPAHTAGLVSHHGFHVLDCSLGPPKHRLGMLVEAALRVGDHPSKASKFVLDRLFGAGGGCVVHLCFSVSEREWNRLRDDTHEPCGLRKLKPSMRELSEEFTGFFQLKHVAQNAICGDDRNAGSLSLNYSTERHIGETVGHKTQKRRVGSPGASRGCGLGRAVVFAGELEEFGFDLLPFRFGFVGDLSVDLVAKGTLVPTLSPSESVEQSVDFGFAQAGTGSVPAALGAFLFDVVPFAAAPRIEGEFNQTQNHHQVSDHLGLIERSAEGPELDSVLAAGQVGQVQQVVAIRFASALGVVFVSVLFDPLGVHHLFAFAGSGRGVDRSFVVADQGNQSCQGGCVAIPANRYVQPAAGIYSAPASVDLVDRVLDLLYAFNPFEYWAYKLASFAAGVLGSDAPVAFCFPSGWQPGYLVSVVVGSDRCVVGSGEGGFEFDSEGDFVCVHCRVPLWFEVCFASRFLRRDDTHEPCVSRNLKRSLACFSQ